MPKHGRDEEGGDTPNKKRKLSRDPCTTCGVALRYDCEICRCPIFNKSARGYVQGQGVVHKGCHEQAQIIQSRDEQIKALKAAETASQEKLSEQEKANNELQATLIKLEAAATISQEKLSEQEKMIKELQATISELKNLVIPVPKVDLIKTLLKELRTSKGTCARAVTKQAAVDEYCQENPEFHSSEAYRYYEEKWLDQAVATKDCDRCSQWGHSELSFMPLTADLCEDCIVATVSNFKWDKDLACVEFPSDWKSYRVPISLRHAVFVALAVKKGYHLLDAKCRSCEAGAEHTYQQIQQAGEEAPCCVNMAWRCFEQQQDDIESTEANEALGY
jgi:hypothetical protein